MLNLNWSAYFKLMRLDKPIGIFLLLWPTLWALLIAGDGEPPWHIVVIFMLGVTLMRSAGCVINDYADRHVDGAVQRTAQRPIVCGQVSARQALYLFSALALIAFGLVLLLNWQTILLSFAALALAASYPFMKRFTHLPQVVLGAAFSWGIPMAFMAVQQQVPAVGWWIFAANVIWTVAYDTQYAMVDRVDDVKVGIKSTAILFGRFDKAIIGALQVLTLLVLIYIGLVLAMHLAYWLGLLVAAALFVYQQWLIRRRDRDKCFQAFLNNHYAGMAIALGLMGHYWLS